MNVIAFAAFAAFAASSLVPARPTAFETVNLRMTVDSCAFAPATVRVAMAANVLRVTQRLNNCFAPGTPQVADVRLGALPSGDYRVEVYATTEPTGTPVEALSFAVRDPAEIAIFPPPPRPLTDYSGLWFNASDPGWGLSLHQGATHTVFGLLFAYNGGGQPEWYSLQDGHWTSHTTWTASVYRTTGAPFLANLPNAAPLQYAPVGSATLDFTQAPGEEGRARFVYTINGQQATRVIARMRL